MQNPPPPTTRPPQKRLRRFIRQPDRLADRQLTGKGLSAVAIIERYRFIPSSLLVRLMPGDRENNYRNLQTLFHKGMVNRFALPKYGGPGEFIYYLDSQASLTTLIEQGLLSALGEEERRRKEELIRYNRQKDYAKLHTESESQGKVLYIRHELMISRFHAMLELACLGPKLAGKISLEQWKQGPELWNRVEVPKAWKTPGSDAWQEQPGVKEFLPHRPDAFFTLYFPNRPGEKQRSHFFYEADRGTENTSRFKLKLRAHFHFIVKQQRQRTTPPYSVHSIRAVLTETTGMQWAQNLRDAAKHPIVSPKPSPLFWFTTSELLTKPTPAGKRSVPLYLQQPEVLFTRIWADPVQDNFFNLAD